MDHGSFDKLARLLGAAGSRRAAIGALLGAGAVGAAETVTAKEQRRARKNRKGRVTAQAVCAPPGVGESRNNCNYENDDFSGQAIHSSSYKNTIFRNADLVETVMHSSNYRDANFRGANLCGADLSSSILRNADFRGFGLPGRETNLTLADLSSSACGGLQTNNRTFICGTTWCDGTIRNDSCPGGVPSDVCCTPCGAGEACVDNACVGVCDEPVTDTSCDCVNRTVDGIQVCRDTINIGQDCSLANPSCPGDQVCVIAACFSEPVCMAPCPFADPCTCPTGVAGCGTNVKCGQTTPGALRRASSSPFKP